MFLYLYFYFFLHTYKVNVLLQSTFYFFFLSKFKQMKLEKTSFYIIFYLSIIHLLCQPVHGEPDAGLEHGAGLGNGEDGAPARADLPQQLSDGGGQRLPLEDLIGAQHHRPGDISEAQ